MLATCHPTASAFECSTTANNQTLPSTTVGICVASVPHIRFGASVMIGRHGLRFGAAGGGAATAGHSPASTAAPACGQLECDRARAVEPIPCDDPRQSRANGRD